MKLDPARFEEASAKVGAILEKMPDVEGTGWAKHVRASVEGVTDLKSLMSKIDAGENEHNFGLALLLRECLVDPPSTFHAIDALPTFDTGIGDFRICHGDLIVDGDLSIEDGLIVTGDLKVRGVLDSLSEWNSSFVCGSAAAHGASIGKVHLLIGGDLAIEEAITVMEGYVGVGGKASAALNIEWLGDIHASNGTTWKHHFASEELAFVFWQPVVLSQEAADFAVPLLRLDGRDSRLGDVNRIGRRGPLQHEAYALLGGLPLLLRLAVDRDVEHVGQGDARDGILDALAPNRDLLVHDGEHGASLVGLLQQNERDHRYAETGQSCVWIHELREQRGGADRDRDPPDRGPTSVARVARRGLRVDDELRMLRGRRTAAHAAIG